MDVIKLPKKFREVCYQIMDGKDEVLDTLEAFSAKYPHQVAAVRAEVAYFNLDYETALNLDLTVLPWLEEWHYGNVSDEHMTARAVAAVQLHREPEEPQTREQLWEQIKAKDKKLTLDDPKGKSKLFYLCCMYGCAKDAVALFEELRGTPLGQAAYEDVIARCLYLGDREKALGIVEELATSRLWAAAAPTQVRPMNFFEDPNLRGFLLEADSLRRIREAAFIDDGSLVRK